MKPLDQPGGGAWKQSSHLIELPAEMENGDRINIVGQRVKDARRRHRPALTQSDLSRQLTRLGVPIDRAGISKLETGIRCVLDYEVVALSKALDVSVGWLVSERKQR